jgi:HEAT repeat protein
MKDNQKPDVGLRAIYALGGIGVPAIPAVTNALADINQTNRHEIVHLLHDIERLSRSNCGSTYPSACLAALTRALNDSDDRLCRQASICLYNLAPESLTNASAK